MFHHSFRSLTTNTAQQMTEKLVPFNLWKAAIQMREFPLLMVFQSINVGWKKIAIGTNTLFFCLVLLKAN